MKVSRPIDVTPHAAFLWLICASLAVFAVSCFMSLNAAERAFTPTDEIIANPGCGWECSAGFYPVFKDLCNVGAIYERVTWASIEPEEGKFTWGPLEFAAQTAEKAGIPFYFYYMAMRVMRAFDYLKSLPEWDGKNLIAEGCSQGGLQTMWAAGLVEGLSEARPGITWGCDIGCPFNGKGSCPSRSWGIPSVPGAFYFDSVFHAKRVPATCRVEITRLGMGDYTCPPRGVLLSYYNLKCPAKANLVQGSTHGYVPPSPNQTFTISK